MSHASIRAVPMSAPIPVRDNRFMLVGTPMLAALFLGVAIWNRFPLMFYDTAAYLAQGLSGAFMVERSPVCSACCFSLRADSRFGRW